MNTRAWPRIRLKYTCQVNPPAPRVADDQEVTFVPMEAVGERGGISIDATRPAGAVRQGYTGFRDGDVVVAKITPCFENGKGSIVSGMLRGVGFGTTELHVLRVQGSDRRWLFYVTQSKHFMGLGEGAMYGAGGQKRVSPDFIRNYETWTPPLPTQKTIADFLDRKTAAIDALIEKKQKLLDLLAEKRAALINQAVTKGLEPNVPMKDSGIPWIGEIPAHWEVWSVRSLLQAHKLTIQDGNHGELHPVASEYVDEGIPFVMANNLRSGQVNLADCKRITKERADRLRIGFATRGDVLLSHKGTIGAVAVLRDLDSQPYFMLTPQVTSYRLRGDLLSADYLACWFEGRAFQEQLAFLASVGSTRAYLGITAQRELSVVVPPQTEQAKILSALSPATNRIDRLSELQASSARRLQEYRQALITAAVTGQLDITGEDAE